MEKQPKTRHAHWLWHQGPAALAGVKKAIALCGAKDLPASQVTCDTGEVTCAACQQLVALAKAPPKAAPADSESADARRRGPKPGAGDWPWSAGARITLLTKVNPCKRGTAKHDRWSIVFEHDGKTWEEYREAGGNPETLRNAVKTSVATVAVKEDTG